jgi:hypothetical protein
MTPERSTTSRTGRAKIAAAAGAAVLAVALLAVGLAGRDAPAPSTQPEAAPPAATYAPASEPPAAEPATRSLTVAPSAPSGASSGKPLAQTYSAYCQTSQGVCVLATAQPIGSACQCAGTPGRVIP